MKFKMREILVLFFLLCDIIVISPSSVKRVRLIDHTSYAISIIQKTMSTVEQRYWCNLKIDDMHVDLSEDVLGKSIFAEIDLKDGFVVSIQKLGIIQSTIQQQWLPFSGNTTRVEVRSTVKMTDLAMGFDVIIKSDGKVSHSTGLIIYPDVQFQFSITKHLFTEEITVDVIGVLPRTTNRMHFTPENDLTKVFTLRLKTYYSDCLGSSYMLFDVQASMNSSNRSNYTLKNDYEYDLHTQSGGWFKNYILKRNLQISFNENLSET